MTGRFGAAIRPEWLLDPDVAFLNHGSFGATPRRVLAAQDRWRAEMEREPVRFMYEVAGDGLRAAAGAVADFVGADAAGLVFTTNATEAVNAVVRSLDFAPGDEIVTTDQAYPGVRNTLDYICRRSGARLVAAALPFPVESDDQMVAAVGAAIGPRTRLAVLDHVASHGAVVMPIARLIALCREHGVPVLVDGAHAPGMLDLDIAALDPDWYVGNAHKWLYAPKGCGLLWARAERRADLHPAVISNQLDQGYTAEFDWTGTRDPSAWLAVTEALDFFRDLGVDAARRYMRALAEEAAILLVERWGTRRGAPPAMTGAMVAVQVPGAPEATRESAYALHERLQNDHRVQAPILAIGGALWVRVSAQVYNDMDDYQRLADALA